MKQHIYALLASERRRLHLSQRELAARAGLRREKVNRVESRQEDLSFEEMLRLLDAVGLVLVAQPKDQANPSSAPAAARPAGAPRMVPQEFDKASFVDGSKARVLHWGKVPA